MKRIKLIFLLCLFQLITFARQTDIQIRLSVCYEEPIETQRPNHRVPYAPIMATQNGHVFVFAPSFVGEIIEVWDDDNLLYTSIIQVDGCVIIPNNLLGEFTLRLIHNERLYSTMVEL